MKTILVPLDGSTLAEQVCYMYHSVAVVQIHILRSYAFAIEFTGKGEQL
jgi:hypothetical protein